MRRLWICLLPVCLLAGCGGPVNGGASTVFLYPRGGRLYLEQPHQGIYEADGTLAELVWEAGE